MNRNKVHVIKLGDAWAAKRHGAKRASLLLKDKQAVIEAAWRMKDVSEVVVHRADGAIESLQKEKPTEREQA